MESLVQSHALLSYLNDSEWRDETAKAAGVKCVLRWVSLFKHESMLMRPHFLITQDYCVQLTAAAIRSLL